MSSGAGGVAPAEASGGLLDHIASLLLRPSSGLIVIVLAVVLTGKTGELALLATLWLVTR